ncbi:MAG TPA: hypothetical protein VMZ22_03565 [Acidimicrobiales bacterium]|nr:hypothetical protein [Acidimicrobiales bacterium]
MAVTVVALLLLNAQPSVLARLTSWDATYYADIARFGYPENIVVAGDRLVAGGLFAFAPLLPVLTAAVHVFGVPVTWAQVALASAAGLVASVGVHLLGREVVGNRRSGYIACALLGVLPMAVTLQMGYAESLAIALGAFSLLAALRRRWWWAASLALVAGLARPTGGVVALAILIVGWSARRSVRWPRPLLATALGAAGLPLWWLFVWVRTGEPDGWFVVQRVGWKTHFDFGAATRDFLTGNTPNLNDLMAVLALGTVAGYLILCVVALRTGASPPLAAVSIVAVVLTLGASNFWYSKPRLLLAAFPLLVLLARPMSRWRTEAVVALIVVGVLASSWWGAYSLTRWPRPI